MTLETGEYQNRGFLHMPICPIYGFGVLMVVTFFRSISYAIIPLFIATGVLCTLFELLIGIGMGKMFHTRWWDYSNERFNYKGYICLKVSLLWGFGCVLVIRVFHPIAEKLIDLIPVKAGLVIILIMSILIVIDLISSICAVNNLNNRLKQIDEISGLMLRSSVKIGEKLANETNEVKEKYDKLINLRDKQVERLLKAYPSIRSISYSESMEKLKEKYYSARFDATQKKKHKTKPADSQYIAQNSDEAESEEHILETTGLNK